MTAPRLPATPAPDPVADYLARYGGPDDAAPGPLAGLLRPATADELTRATEARGTPPRDPSPSRRAAKRRPPDTFAAEGTRVAPVRGGQNELEELADAAAQVPRAAVNAGANLLSGGARLYGMGERGAGAILRAVLDPLGSAPTAPRPHTRAELGTGERSPEGFDAIATGIDRGNAHVQRALAPRSRAGQIAAPIADVAANLAPYAGAGRLLGVASGALASAGLTAAQSARGREASTTALLAELTGSETLGAVAARPGARVAADAALDLGTSALFAGAPALARALRDRAAAAPAEAEGVLARAARTVRGDAPATGVPGAGAPGAGAPTAGAPARRSLTGGTLAAGRPGFITGHGLAALSGGAVGGTAGGVAGAQFGDTPAERRERALVGTMLGAAAGAAAGVGAARAGSALLGRVARAGQAAPAYAADPDVAAVLGTIATGARREAAPTGLLSRAQKAYTAMVDELYPLRRFGRVVGGPGAAGEALADETTRAGGWRGAAEQRMRDELRPVLTAAKGHEAGVMALAKARRALELSGQGLEKTDIPDDVLQRTVQTLEQVPEVKAGADALTAYYRGLLDHKAANGVLSPEAYRAITASEQHYSPFAREFTDAAGDALPGGAGGAAGGGGAGGRFVNAGPGVRKLGAGKARARTVDPFEQAVLDTFETERSVARQRVSNTLAGLVEANPAAAAPYVRALPAGATPAPGREGRVVMANIDGVRQRFEVLDPDLFKAWASFTPETQSIAVRLLAPFKRALQAGTTTLPDFALANALRDNAHVALQYPLRPGRLAAGAAAGGALGAGTADDGERLEHAFAGAALGAGASHLAPVVGRTLRAVGGIVGDSPAYREFLREGGASFGFYPRTKADARTVLAALRRDGVSLGDVVSPRRWWDALQHLNGVVEEAPRFARYQAAREGGAGAAEAVREARDVSLDFTKQGAETKGVAAVTAFWNAKVQGWDKLARMLDPRTKAGRNAWAAGMTTITAPSVALWMRNRDNPEYWERPQWERNMFRLVPKGGEAGGFWRIPKPFEVGFAFASLPERLLDYTYTREHGGDADPGETLASSARDMRGTTFDGTVPLPTGAQPVLENATNYDFFRNRAVVARPNLPKELQADERTSSLALGLGQVSGQSPQQVDHLLRGFTGAAGGMALDVGDRVARAAGLDARPLPVDAPAVPVLGAMGRRFSTRAGVTSDAEQTLYRRAEEVTRIQAGVRELEKRGDAAALEAYVREHLDELADERGVVAAAEALRDLRRQRRQIATARELPLADKREALAELDEQLAAKAREALASAPTTRTGVAQGAAP